MEGQGRKGNESGMREICFVEGSGEGVCGRVCRLKWNECVGERRIKEEIKDNGMILESEMKTDREGRGKVE